jgi:hypothetical protein
MSVIRLRSELNRLLLCMARRPKPPQDDDNRSLYEVNEAQVSVCRCIELACGMHMHSHVDAILATAR